ncbi:tetratricopeptide repeat protein [Alteromonas facilis]|uniref:tetratricopeptide repeat protein n=1 Tax=Alteromonas facilis TaxID=2048004 RepID=UPI000C2889BC|nr:tetratricopeptide repeat protein [Alteromonas facilis]
MSGRKLQINQWLIDMSSGEVWLFDSDAEKTQQYDPIARIEPKGIYLLKILSKHVAQLIEKDQLLEVLWPGQVVSEDSLTRCVSRVRKVLNDDPKSPSIIETLPKRGYRLIAQEVRWHGPINEIVVTQQETTEPPSSIVEMKPHRPVALLISTLVVGAIFIGGMFLVNPFQKEPHSEDEGDFILSQADDYYMQMRRQDNEMAIDLYQQAMALRPSSSHAQAGLANAIVQQVIRWPAKTQNTLIQIKSLADAIEQGLTQSEQAQRKLARAQSLAQSAVELDPRSAKAYKALGFVHAALGQFDSAITHYEKAVELDKHAWDAYINIGDTLELKGQQAEAIPYFERAFSAMTVVYKDQSAQIAPWYADMGAMIGHKYQELGNMQQAELWYRHVLSFAPLNARATQRLATILFESGETASAERLCNEFKQRVGNDICVQFSNE